MSIVRGVSVLLVCFCACAEPQPEQQQLPEFDLAFAGDMLLDRGVRNEIEKHGVDHLFSGLSSVGFHSELFAVNLECPITSVEAPIQKKFVFRADPEWLDTLKMNGITHLNLANNHTNDHGRIGINSTIENIEYSGIGWFGAFSHQGTACNPVFTKVNGQEIALLASVTVPLETWAYLENKAGPCQATVNQLVEEVRSIKEAMPNAVIIVSFHWGVEYHTTPTMVQVKGAHDMIDAGADAVIGHHPHVIQPIEIYKGKPIFYSLGNFIFDQQREDGQEGIMACARFENEELQWHVIPYNIEKGVPIPSVDLDSWCNRLNDFCGTELFQNRGATLQITEQPPE